MANETLGARLTRLRKEKGMTQSDIADKLSVTAQAVSKWENDQASPDIDILIRLSELYDISLDELLGREKPKVSVQDKPNKKTIDKMFFRIRVNSNDGDIVNVNLPLAIVRAFVNKETGKVKILEGNKALEGIDFAQLIDMVEQGIIGELVNIQSADGDQVSIFVE